MKTLTFLPDGGLGNRMRAICSARAMAEELHLALDIIWLRDWAVGAPFTSIFQPLEGLREATPFENLALHHASRKTLLGLPWLYKHLQFDRNLEDQATSKLFEAGIPISQWVQEGKKDNERLCIASCLKFHDLDDADFAHCFKPTEALEKRIRQLTDTLPSPSIGIHIRRGDHTVSAQASPTELFFEAIDRELDAHPDLSIYLATDSEAVKAEMTARYGQHIHTSGQVASRDNVAGIQDSVVEMFTLARTQRIYGSFRSSFSNIASKLGQKPLTIIKRPDIQESGITF